ncbi:hypothetical protein [Spirulina major]|uniref:hypothetical protein n=1 Tax=Spirulina major TaxID=270636 RepID=UPI001C31DFF4|nr:hypothetical protein [Spirulina major]
MLLSMMTLPFLGTVLLVDAIAQHLQTLGETSEELLRGDRLPTLPFPEPHPSQP